MKSPPPGFLPPKNQEQHHIDYDPDAALDEGLKESFPASDPVAVDERPDRLPKKVNQEKDGRQDDCR